MIAIGVLAAVWDWDWFRPLVAREASAALGRTVTLQHFDLRLGRLTAAVADGVRIANPTGFAQDPPLAAVERLMVTIDTMELLRHRAVVVPDILIEQPQIAATQAEDGRANYLFPALSSGGNGPGAKVGNLRITGAHVVLARLRTDFNIVVETHVADGTPQVVAHATGSYAGQPINADFVGAALLSLRDVATPYPVNLKVANGPTHATLVGNVQDPLNFALGRMLKATNLVGGSGVFGGRAVLETTGNSMATMLANGNGSLQLTMAGGGDLSALLVDLSGLQFGNALLSALGVPDRDKIECFVAYFGLQGGELQTRALLLDTTSDIISGSGTINLRTESLDYQIRTEAKHFTIGSLAAPISITGSFKHPGALPEITKLAVRGGAATGLGLLFPPAAILPTIEFGVGDDHHCEALMRRAK